MRSRLIDVLHDQDPDVDAYHEHSCGMLRVVGGYQPLPTEADERVKIECSTVERFPITETVTRPLELPEGDTIQVQTLPVDELISTKVRALHGRRKGRDVDHLIQARPLLEDPDLLRKMPIYYFYRSQIVYDPELIHEEMTDESQIEGFRRDIARILTWLAGTPERRRAQLQLVRVLEELDGAHQLAEHERLGQLDAWRLSAGP